MTEFMLHNLRPPRFFRLRMSEIRSNISRDDAERSQSRTSSQLPPLSYASQPPPELAREPGITGTSQSAVPLVAQSPALYGRTDSQYTYPLMPTFIQLSNSNLGMTQSATPGSSNPRRAYRQRRKDPSCDACRERKVKCDATETSACTECTTRNVRCQFTKETNRRMSSMKQVQDLERQLQTIRQELDELRSGEQSLSTPRLNVISEGDIFRSTSVISPTPSRASRTSALQSFEARAGVLELLPDQQSAQQYLHAYHECIHRLYPVLYWPRFISDFWRMYHVDQLSKLEPSVTGTALVVLALGALHSLQLESMTQSQQYFRAAMGYVDVLGDGLPISSVVIIFLVSIYLLETNKRSGGWVWLGSAVRVAQDNGLHLQFAEETSIEDEIQRRIWWSLYVREKLFGIELSRPTLIDDDDCDAEYPTILEEEQSLSEDPFHPSKPTSLLSSILVARLSSPLARLCRQECIPTDQIRNFDAQLADCMRQLPPQLRLDSQDPLDPLAVAPLIYLQNARIILHRQNLSPSCSSQQRSVAIQDSISAAMDTVRTIVRIYTPSTASANIEGRLLAASNMLMCTHLWRCMLLLAFGNAWPQFHTLLRISTLISDKKPINSSCGRHLSLFLRCLIDRYQVGNIATLEQDEEVILYLSADLLTRPKSPAEPRRRSQGTEAGSPLRSGQQRGWDSMLAEKEEIPWQGWGQVLQEASRLEQLSASALISKSTEPPSTASSVQSKMKISSII